MPPDLSSVTYQQMTLPASVINALSRSYLPSEDEGRRYPADDVIVVVQYIFYDYLTDKCL